MCHPPDAILSPGMLWFSSADCMWCWDNSSPFLFTQRAFRKVCSAADQRKFSQQSFVLPLVTCPYLRQMKIYELQADKSTATILSAVGISDKIKDVQGLMVLQHVLHNNSQYFYYIGPLEEERRFLCPAVMCAEAYFSFSTCMFSKPSSSTSTKLLSISRRHIASGIFTFFFQMSH